jgi:hypothetical protein
MISEIIRYHYLSLPQLKNARNYITNPPFLTKCVNHP